MYTISDTNLKIISLYLCNYHKRYYLREISRLSGLTLKTTQNSLNNLESQKILKSETVGKNKYFSLNRNNIDTKFYLLQAEIFKTSMFIEKYPLMKPFIKDLNLSSEPLVIFGSFADGTADKKSDLDILVISEKDTNLKSHILPYKIHNIVMSEKLFREGITKKEALIFEIFDHHLILDDFSFLINCMWDYYG